MRELANLLRMITFACFIVSVLVEEYPMVPYFLIAGFSLMAIAAGIDKANKDENHH